jgi:hypothetical protein
MIWECNRFTSSKVEVVVDSLWHRFTDLAVTIGQIPAGDNAWQAKILSSSC